MDRYVTLSQSFSNVTKAQAWAALTTPELIEKWLMPNDFAAKEGHDFTLDAAAAGSWEGKIHCSVAEIDPEAGKMVWTWTAKKRPSRVIFQIKEHPDRCHITITHNFGSGLMPWLFSMAYKGTWAKALTRKLGTVFAEMEA